MKWKDSDEIIDKEEETPGSDYFDEEQFSPWSGQNDQKKAFAFGKVPLQVVLLAIAIIASLTALFMLLTGADNNGTSAEQFSVLEARVSQLEERLEKYEAMDDKVARIWEQAKSYEKFESRFDRSEASMSLRMDHLTMSLEALQKQVNASKKKPAPQPTAKSAKPDEPTPPASSEAQNQYHQVVAGDTLYSISKRYNLSVDELLKFNGMDKNTIIVPGQKLIVSKGAGE
jgi:LysM repeat protein